jgi:hypothetical protein
MNIEAQVASMTHTISVTYEVFIMKWLYLIDQEERKGAMRSIIALDF